MDAASRRILGFTLSGHHDAAAAYGALAMAITVRSGQVPGVIMHTDQGSEYTARAFQAACQRLGIAQSMGRPGSALDNAVIESWHSTLEFELRRIEHFATRAAARIGLREYREQKQDPHYQVSTVRGEPRRHWEDGERVAGTLDA